MKLGGGVVSDALCYSVCASRLLMQREPSVVCATIGVEAGCDVDTSAAALLLFAGGVTALATAGWQRAFQSTYAVWGSTGRIALERAFAVLADHPVLITWHHDDQAETTRLEPADQTRLMIESFAGEIVGLTTPQWDWEADCLAQARALEAVRRAAAEGRAVRPNEIA